MHVLTWQPLDSSVLSSAAYVPAEHLLYLRFRRGSVYRYFDFPPEKYRDFLAAESKGKYFSSDIREQFRCEQLPASFTVQGR